MNAYARIRKGEYHDSVTLMLLTKELLAAPGVADAAIVMGTEANKALLADSGLLSDVVRQAEANDLIISVRAASPEEATAALTQAERLLQERRTSQAGEDVVSRPKTLKAALQVAPDANLAVISVAGRYAAREARAALEQGLHVLLFSDNVPLADEIALKILALEKGLLLMGPDAGTSIINGIALGLANAVPRGPVGIVGASGTGIQGISVGIAQAGSGVSQAIGVGGRDLSEEVGGLMMEAALRALQDDPATKVLCLVSKPPAPTIARRVLETARTSRKPVVVCFLGDDGRAVRSAGLYPAATLDEAAMVAAALARGIDPETALAEQRQAEEGFLAQAEGNRARLNPEQKYVRGLFSGGTFCYEAQLVLRDLVGPVHSNAPLDKPMRLADANRSVGHTCVDLGEDEFTVGRLHPMMDNGLRIRRLLKEGDDPATAVILLDVVLGYGAHPDPAGELSAAIGEAKARAQQAGRHLAVVAYVCGVANDPQRPAEQEEKLRAAGAILAPSNAAAARLAVRMVR
ncbi:MAG: acyl-CoA synthetase FdrA [Anaerolineae bacterium]|nr:acyl-CoA synthetase FdrA [Anaerolineae bacterium]